MGKRRTDRVGACCAYHGTHPLECGGEGLIESREHRVVRRPQEISPQTNRKNRNRHHQSSQLLSLNPDESEKDEAADEKPVVTTAKSEIELPTATPKPTATATPAKPSPTPAPRAKQLQNQSRNQLPGKRWWRKPLQNRRQNPSRAQRKRAPSRRKKTKLFSQKRIPRLRAQARKADQQVKLAMAAVEAARPNLAGMATCCMIVFTAPGSSRPRRSLRAQKFRHS